ncbi:prolyl oligopeptidase family serine peptidase [Qipengyuania sp.]|uniref:prolyl oligopeptidase family serine peptidase n=1 Tax=Qipengyuania sp. TaxID=2004515 RepID=UPI003734D052
MSPFVSVAALFAVPLHAQTPADDAATGGQRAMTATDLVTMPRLGAPSVSRDGAWALYPVTTTADQTFKRTTRFYLHRLDRPGAAPMALPIDGSSAVFGPDGAIYYLAADAEDRAQVWRLPVGADGTPGTAAQVTRLPRAIDGFSVSPNGKALAIWAALPRTCTDFGCDDSVRPYAPGPGNGRLYQGNEGLVRHWDAWETPGTLNRVFVVPLAQGRASGTPVPVDGPIGAGGPAGDTPTMPYGGGEDIAWAPDGSALYFAARQADGQEPYSVNIDIWRAEPLRGGAPINLTDANEALDTMPTPSPDGQYLAYLAMARPGYEADRQVIMLRDLKTGVTSALTEGFDRSFSSLAWTPDSRWLVATAQDVLDTPAFRIDPRSGTVDRLDLMAGDEAHIANVVPLHGQRLLFSRDSIGAPAELFIANGWGQAKPLTMVATRQIGALAPVSVERFSFKGANGATVWGQITKPADVGGRLPVILYVHGGPQGSFNDAWSSRWNPRVVASQGYAVVSVDFHGSTGYGQAFTDAINRDWGGKPLEDLKLGLAAALERDRQIDGTRACAMGASYGGYMMNWIEGQWPDRFDCLVQHNGLFDMRAFYYSTEELWFPRWDFGGGYADQPALYEKWNPINHLSEWRTPMLVTIGERDFRVPYTQGLAAFTALKEKGIPSQLLVFPDENHWVLQPANSVQWHDTVFAWLDRWLKPGDE